MNSIYLILRFLVYYPAKFLLFFTKVKYTSFSLKGTPHSLISFIVIMTSISVFLGVQPLRSEELNKSVIIFVNFITGFTIGVFHLIPSMYYFSKKFNLRFNKDFYFTCDKKIKNKKEINLETIFLASALLYILAILTIFKVNSKL